MQLHHITLLGIGATTGVNSVASKAAALRLKNDLSF
jgi:hypothetical protein